MGVVMFAACALYVLLPLGFLMAAWVVSKVPILKKTEGGSMADSAIVVLLLSSLFGTYTYLISHWLRTSAL